MARFIFIFPNILVYFLIIVSKSVFAFGFPVSDPAAGKDTINWIWRDDFEYGNISDWKQTNDWEVSAVEPINGTNSLKNRNSGVSGVSSVFHTLRGDLAAFDYQWTFSAKNGKWDPSSSNKFWFYLCADTIKPELISGYAVGVNVSGSNDLLQLWRLKKGKADSLIVQTDLDWNSVMLVGMEVLRTAKGEWKLRYKKAGAEFGQWFGGTDRFIPDFRNVGFYFKYTATRSGQLWIDDVAVGRSSPKLSIQKLTLIDGHHLEIDFNLPIDPASVKTSCFSIKDESGADVEIKKASFSSKSDKAVVIEFGDVQRLFLSLTAKGIVGLMGEEMEEEARELLYAFSPEPGAVLINEVLFNPFSGGTDFVELVNVGDYPVSVARLRLASRNDTLGLKQLCSISSGDRFLLPGDYLLCTKDSAAVASRYFSADLDAFCPMTSFPTLPDDAGWVVLLNDSMQVIDELHYTAQMHSPFIADEEGVSLERISIDKPASDPENWTSAAASAGFGTPGLPNSISGKEKSVESQITVSPEAFSPNGDGVNDQLTIRYRFAKPGYVANIRIFDAVGRLVRYLVKNQSLAQEGSWIWDGTGDSGQKQNIGVYIILVEVFDQNGQTKAFRKTCTVTDRLH